MFLAVVIQKNDIPAWWIWGYYIGFHSYAFDMFMVNEFKDKDLLLTNNPPYQSGNQLLAYYNMQYSRIWVDIVVLCAWMVGARLVYAFTLHFLHKGKR